MPTKTIRIHWDGGTQDVPVVGKSPKAAQTEAYYIMREGFWVDNKLFSPSRISFVELIEK